MSDLVLVENFDLSIFEVVNGKVNLTKICKHFGKDINEWKRLPNTQRFLTAYTKKDQGLGLSQTLGKGKEQGTFGDRRIALKLAEWISVEFELFANEKLDELLQTGKTEIVSQQKQIPQNYIEALKAHLEDQEKILELETKIEQDKDKVEFATALLDTTNAIDMATCAKVLKLPFGRNTLFTKLRDFDILDRKNRPYQIFVNNGYFVVLESSFIHPKTGDNVLTTKTMVTAKGQKYLLNKLTKGKELQNT
jgi:phage antirepressor YoqD-like protein